MSREDEDPREHLCEYELQRQQRVARNHLMMAALNIGILANQLRKAGEDAAAAASADSAASGGGAGPSTSARGARRQASPPPEFHMGLRERKPVDYKEKRLANERPRRALSFDPLPPRVIPMPVLVDRSRRTAAGTSAGGSAAGGAASGAAASAAAGSSSAAANVPRRKPFGDWNLEFLTLCAFMAAHPQRAIDALRRLALRLWKDGQELFVESMKEPGGPFQRCLATCARERAAREAEEKEAKKFEEYLYANVNLETGEMLAPEEAPSLLPAGDAPAAAAAAAPASDAVAPAAAAPSAKRPRVPDGGASAPKRRRREGEQRCSNPTCPRPEHTSDCWRSSRDGSGEVLCKRCYYRQPPPGVTACGKCARVESSQWRHSRADSDLVLCVVCFRKEPPYPGCTCAGCGASETSEWKTAPTGEHAGKPVCRTCYERERKANAKKRG